jgi:hypothetical protein
MKKLFAVLTAVALMVLPSVAADSFGVNTTTSPSGFVHQNMTTNTGPIAVFGSSTTNLTGNSASILAVPSDGFAVYLRTGGTNSTDTTNLTIVLEAIMYPTGTASGGTQVVDNVTLSIVTPTTASALPTGYDYLTNFSVYALAALPSPLLRADGIRVRSIQNTNLNTLWVSNLFMVRNPGAANPTKLP